jgi:hypothetical protein
LSFANSWEGNILEEGKENYEKALVTSGLAFIGGFLMLADPRGTFEINWAFAIMFWFSAFLNLLRFRYAKHEDKFWLEEGMESMILVGFALPGVILGLYFYPS